MRKKVSLLFLLFLVAAHPFSFAQQSGEPFFTNGEGVNFIGNSITHPDPHASSTKPFGVNLAGAEFGSNMPGKYNTDYTYPTTAELDYFKSKGLELVRMPFRWERIQPTLNAPLDPAELQRMKSFVEAAAARDVQIILDMHNYGRRKMNGAQYIIGDPALPVASVADAWERIADEFKVYDNIWAYGIMNEPYSMSKSPWFDIAQAIITEIRTTDVSTTILVGGDSWSSAERWPSASDNLKNLHDPSGSLVFEAHVYFDNDASGSYDQSYEGEGASPTTGIDRVAPFVNWLETNGLEGFIGEYGVPADDPRWLETLDNFLAHLQEKDINGTYWAAGPWWGGYKLSVEPKNGVDRPQMMVLENYNHTGEAGESDRDVIVTHDWDFNEAVVNRSIQGWSIVNYDNPVAVDGILNLSGSQRYNNISYTVQEGDIIDPEVSQNLIIRLKNETDDTRARFYFWGSETSAAAIELEITSNDSVFKEYVIDLSVDERWAGRIDRIRVDIPLPLTETSYGKSIRIDHVKLTTQAFPTPDMPDRDPAPFGVNMSGAEFGENIPGVFNTDYTYPTTYELDYFKSKGFTMYRLPFKWERIQKQLNGPLDQDELIRMKNFVNTARSKGLWVLLDMHNYGRRKIDGMEYIIGDPQLSIASVADAWKKLADEFKPYENIWGYGIMNEPHAMLESTPWFDIAQDIITEIRKTDTTTPIVVGGDSWSSAERWLSYSDNLKNLNDPSDKLIFEAHVYFDDDASGKYDQSYDAEGATPNTGIGRVFPFVNWLKNNNLKGFVGEYGVPDDDPRWLVTLDNFLGYLRANEINGTYWSAGPWWHSYKLAVEPINGEDRPQMATLEKHLYADGEGDGEIPGGVTNIWNFDAPVAGNKVEGWSIVNYKNASTTDGILSLTGEQTYNNLKYDVQAGDAIIPALSTQVVIRLKNETADTLARFYWWEPEVGNIYDYVEFNITANDTDFKEYVLDLSENQEWINKPVLRIIRFDIPVKVSAASFGSKISVDYIKLVAPGENSSGDEWTLMSDDKLDKAKLDFTLFADEVRNIKAIVYTSEAFNGKLVIDDMYGNRVCEIDCGLTSGKNTIDSGLINLRSGIYIATIFNKQKISSKRFLIRY